MKSQIAEKAMMIEWKGGNPLDPMVGQASINFSGDTLI